MVKNKTVLHAMLQWSGTQDPWVLDALGRIFRGDQITNVDIARYVTSLLSDQPPEGFMPLSEDELPTSMDGRDNVSLVSIGNLEGINRMAPGYVLEFGPGLTIVYGSNGAGKSGYCRVLKRACHS
ncbi:MAG: ATP-binding protein [Rectinemataceae bacterium]|nr:ATP-binding protein [Rectinemataceae bacterium]